MPSCQVSEIRSNPANISPCLQVFFPTSIPVDLQDYWLQVQCCWSFTLLGAHQDDKYCCLTDMTASRHFISTDEIVAHGMQSCLPPFIHPTGPDVSISLSTSVKIKTSAKQSNNPLQPHCIMTAASSLYPPFLLLLSPLFPPSLLLHPMPDCLLLQLSPAWLQSQHTREKK